MTFGKFAISDQASWFDLDAVTFSDGILEVFCKIWQEPIKNRFLLDVSVFNVIWYSFLPLMRPKSMWESEVWKLMLGKAN
jgi:hypothetical protein